MADQTATDFGGTSSRRTVFHIGDADNPGDFFVIQCDLNQLNYTSDVTIEEGESFCQTQKDYGTENGTIDGTGFWSGDVLRAYRALKKAQRQAVKVPYKYGPGGDANGAYGLSGIAIVGNVRIGAQVGQLVGLTFNMGIDGLDHEFLWPNTPIP